MSAKYICLMALAGTLALGTAACGDAAEVVDSEGAERDQISVSDSAAVLNPAVAAPVEGIIAEDGLHPCTWAEMDTAQEHCDDHHGVHWRTYLMRSCNIVACNASSTTIYYSYTVP
ncbi:MAG: hypothetical protein U0174_26280 [Polyangiaceae bacterium]